MCLAFLKIYVASAIVLVGCSTHQSQPQSTAVITPSIKRPVDTLRVCADPNNLPFSNQKLEGFENKIAQLLADDLGQKLDYTWWAQRRGFFRNTLKAGNCDVVLGVPAGLEMTLNTRPYYRSTYVFVSRKDSGLSISSFDDDALKKVRVGVQMIGDDFNNTPPAEALSRRRIIDNVRGFTVYGNYSEPNPVARIIDAVGKKQIDVAIAWGPMAAYFAKQEKSSLVVVPVSPQFDQSSLPFVYDISMGVRREDRELRDQLESFLDRRQGDIEKILKDYSVPLVR
jgi:mxaJ protein